jgi:hypothetical protein
VARYQTWLGKIVEPLFDQILEYCRKSYITESVFDPGSGAYARLEVLRLSDRKTTTAGSRTFDDTGKEVSYSHTGTQWWNWGNIKPGSTQETLFAAVLAYCRENVISLE